MATEEYIKAIKKERDELKKKYKELQKEFNTSDDALVGRIKQWVKNNDTPAYHESYGDSKWMFTILKRIINGEIRFDLP